MHAVVAESRIEGAERSDQVGCVRSFTLRDGNRIREQLLSLSDAEHRSTYCIVESTVPPAALCRHADLEAGDRWPADLLALGIDLLDAAGRERELRDMVAQGVYEAGFENLRRYLGQGGDLRPPGGGAMPAALAMPTRRVSLQRYGEAEVLQGETAECAAPAEGEVRIRQRAIVVNFIDVYLRRGWVPAMLPLSGGPGVPGMEAAGTVLDVGHGVNSLLPGDRVAYVGPVRGAYCGLRSVPADWIVRLPPEVEDEVAAALLVKGITADYLLRDLGRVGPGTRLLVHAAAGGVACWSAPGARRLGAQVIGTVSATRRRASPASTAASSHRQPRLPLCRRGAAACGGADVLIDGLGDAASAENLAALARRGHWISLARPAAR